MPRRISKFRVAPYIIRWGIVWELSDGNLPKIFSEKIGWKVIVRNVTSVELNRHHITREQRSKSGFAIPTSDSHTLIWALYTLPAL